jgi:hypothetical protein
MITMHFERTFTKGTLKGLTCPDSIRFVDEAAAARWLADVTANASHIGYTVRRINR